MAVKLDKVDRRILFELDRNARIPDTRLAKIVGRSKESVRYRVKKLQDQGVIEGFTTWIDVSKLGFQSAKIYLNIANDPKKKKSLIDFVKKDSRLFWLGVAEGSWNIGLTYFVRDNREFFDVKNELFSKFKDLILESSTAVLVDVSYTDKKFFHNTKSSWSSMFSKLESVKLDAIEKKILRELYQNARVNRVDIAINHKTSVDVVGHRIKKLEKAGIIVRYLAKINYELLGYEFFKTFLHFKNLTNEDEKNLMQYCAHQEKIIHVVKQISPWDVELEVMCENFLEYNQIISDLTKHFSHIIKKVETAIMTEDHVFPAKKMIFE